MYPHSAKFAIRSFFTRSRDNKGYSKSFGNPWIRPGSLFSKIFNGLLFYGLCECPSIHFICRVKIHINMTEAIRKQDATLSQGQPRDAPYISVP